MKEEILGKTYNQLRRTRICSLLLKQYNQDIPDDFLMWSHYANSHTGCCIEIKLTGQHNKSWNIIPVSYKSLLPKVKENLEDTINNIVSVKNTIWNTEHEIRAVRQYKSQKEFASNSPFYHIKIVAVYFGMRVSAAKTLFYSKIIKNMDSQIKVFKMKTSKTNNGFYPQLVKEEIKL